MKDHVITSLLEEFKSGKITAKEAVIKLANSGIRPKNELLKRFVDKWRLVRGLDWTYYYSDDPGVYESGVVRWDEIKEKAANDDILSMALAIVGKEVYEGTPKLVESVTADWSSDREKLVVGDKHIAITAVIEISYGVSFRKRYIHMDSTGTLFVIEPPKVTKEMVIEAASNGMPVVKWHDWGFASAYADSEEFYGWRLLVRPYNRDLTRGAIFVVPTITDTRRIHRAGKIKHIAEISGQPLIWAKSYYSRSKKVKYAIEDRVVEKVANYSGSTYEEWQQLPEENARERAVKRMVALINQFEGA